ncbi:hypothetical protein ACK3SF_02160 [Candidatus Nanosalina sp. VS9-1]|uniref:hypothetical protein n=1 Tax=Candidatus Nanosalina sp. VS9-1 TaxID=3388566 RepID=UPI0039E0417D
MILQNPILLALGLVALPLLYRAYSTEDFRTRFLAISYAAIFVVLAVAAASPQIQQETSQMEESRLIFLEDSSRSMVLDRPNISLEDVTVEERTLATGNSSSIKQGMMAMLEPNTTYLVSSDLQDDSNFRDVAEAYSQVNSDINFLKASMKRERSVSITGPSTAVPNAVNSYTVKVHSTIEGEERPEVFVDGEEVDTEETEEGFVFEKEFSETGYHRIRAGLESEDQYSENNQFFRSVKVIERPEVLVVGDQGSLGEKIQEYFDLEYSDTVPQDLSKYYSIILKKNIDSSAELKNYLTDGNGLVYTGDGTMDVLPLEKREYDIATSNPKIIIGIDNSQGFTDQTSGGCTVGDSIKESKQLGTSLVTNLAEQRPESIVGAFAYNNTVWEFGDPQPLSNEAYRNKLLGTETQGGLASIPVCGTAYQIQALQASMRIIGNSPGNIILITDGKIPKDSGILGPSGTAEVSSSVSKEEYEQRALEVASNIPDNVSLHTVAVGESPNRDFLEKLAEEGNGVYYEGTEEFYALENRFQGGGGSDMKGISVVDPNHFITEGLGSLSSTATDFEDVGPRPSARTLIESTHNRPFLTTWRYGLGRVAAFSGGGPDLENLMSQEPVVLSRTLNWAVGNPERKEDGSVTVSDGRMGEEVVLTTSVDREGFVRVAESRYRATTRPEETGFHEYFGNQFDYNYRPEIGKLGYREEVMERLARVTGGQVLNESSIDGLEGNVKTRTVETVKSRTLTSYFLLLALILFLIQVGYRKSKGWM